ncbi:hypothetical protein NC652_026497 [Populus alba x Populus x berolinensis]|nr:hypothetical protein NC652_026497 [Populus alba x Populus x berolinensis]
MFDCGSSPNTPKNGNCMTGVETEWRIYLKFPDELPDLYHDTLHSAFWKNPGKMHCPLSWELQVLLPWEFDTVFFSCVCNVI